MKLRMLKRLLWPHEVCVGAGSVERIGCLDSAKILLVTTGSARKTGALEKMASQLKCATASQVLELPAGEPQASTIEALQSEVTTFSPEWILAVGGGSVIDAAKFLWAQYEHPELALTGTSPVTVGPLRQKARFIAVPTTAGSGSEASQVAVLSGEDGAKIPFVSSDWVPDIVILDPTLTVSLPRELTVATGFDALTHAVESAVSSLGNPFLPPLAATAVKLIVKHLPVAAENPGDLTARGGMLEAAFLAGACQSIASTGAAHALSHASSKMLGAQHGASTGFFLLPTMRWNLSKNAALYDELAYGCGFENGTALVMVLAELATRLGVPQSFKEFVGKSLEPDNRQKLAELASKDVCLRTNAARMKQTDLAQLISEIG